MFPYLRCWDSLALNNLRNICILNVNLNGVAPIEEGRGGMMETVKSRRHFMCRLVGLASGVVLAGPKELRAARQETKNVLGQLELDALKSSRPRKNPSIMCRREGEETTLYREERGEEIPIYRMNLTGRMIWEACNGRRSLSDISRLIIEQYQVTPYQAQLDTFAFLALLKKTGAVWV